MRAELRREAAPLRQQVVELLRAAIVGFDFQPGERLVERVLCERYAVSRTVVREALRQLESEGLVALVPNRGPVVAVLTEADAAALYEVRAVLEALAGRSFAERATAEQRAGLKRRLAQVRAALRDGELATVLAAKDGFYDALLDGAGNDVIRTTLRGVHARISLLRGLTLQAPGRAPHTERELAAITAAALAGDGDAAWAACEAHVRSAAAVAMEQLRTRQGEEGTA
ncbi:GntR family transcriptional regulator [Pseudonocardia acaciae]|uniref:GntR family transcriptional regulator n=1 Tax=Pseudonocardia acaciae TaxID=551276 RepID=UPI00056A7E51|nr:GntR family transcriptional regulator [Pseudonocardia acaciae]